MSDLEDEMERTKERAAAFGVSGETDDEDEEDVDAEEDVSESATETSTAGKVDEESEAEEALETSEISATDERATMPEINESDASAAQEQTANNGSSDTGGESKSDGSATGSEESSRGRLVDEYDNVNIYIPPELKRELNDLFKLMDLEYSRSQGGDLEKHWDFYPAVVRTVLENEDDLRSELGIDR